MTVCVYMSMHVSGLCVCMACVYVCAYDLCISEMTLSTLGHKSGVPFFLVLDLLLTATWNQVPPNTHTQWKNGDLDS